MIAGAKLVLVQGALQVLVVSNDDFALLSDQGTPFFSIQPTLAVKVHATDLALSFGLLCRHAGKDDVLQDCGDHLLASPQWLWLEYRGR